MNYFMKISRERVFSIALIIYIIWKNVITAIKWQYNYQSIMNQLSSISMFAVIALLLYCFFLKRNFLKKQFMLFLIMLGSSLITYYVTKSNGIIFITLFLFGVEKLDYNNLIRKYAITQLICITVILIAYFCGMSKNVISYWSYGSGISFGTYHANNFATIVLSCYLVVCYCFFKNKLWMEYALGIVTFYALWTTTLSRTNCILIMLYPVLHSLVLLFNKVKSLFVFRVLKWSSVALLVISAFLTLFYSEIFGNSSDGTFVSRFIYSFDSLQQYGIHLFGNYIHYVSTEESLLTGVKSVILDSAYMKLLINYGLIATLFVLGSHIKAMNKAFKYNDYVLLIIGAIISISGLTEGMLIGISSNFILLGAWAKYKISSTVTVRE